jgi:hypothetical protein
LSRQSDTGFLGAKPKARLRCRVRAIMGKCLRGAVAWLGWVGLVSCAPRLVAGDQPVGDDPSSSASGALSDGGVAIGPGLAWPSNQSFPSFAPFTALDVIDLDGRPADEATLLATLQGLVNRTQPRIYLLSGQGEGKTFWLDQISATKTNTTDALGLVQKYAAEVAGLVIDDPAQIDTVNLATTIAGVENGVVVSPGLAVQLQAAPYNLPVLVDLRNNHFASKLAVYQYGFDNYVSRGAHRLIIGITGQNAAGPRDLAVATGAAVVWLDPTVPAELSLLQSHLARLETNSPYLGWWTNENLGVAAASRYAIPTYAGDYSCNLSVLGGTPRTLHVPPPPPPPVLANKIYVSIFMSDGDNLQMDQHLIPQKWRDANRGKVPIAWTINPALVDAAPLILDYFWSTATDNDVLVSGPSGLGYTYPDNWLASSFELYAERSGNYLSAAGLRAITVWNNGAVDLTGELATAYVEKLPRMLGVTLQNASQASQALGGTLPMQRFAAAYAADEAGLEAAIDGGVLRSPAPDGGTRPWPGNVPLFIAVQGNMGRPTISPTAFYNVQQKYAGDPHISFVRADHFFQLIRQASALPTEPGRIGLGPVGDFDGDRRADYADRSFTDGTIRVFTNPLSGFVAQPSWRARSAAGPDVVLLVGDFDGDGKADCAERSRRDGHLVVHLNTGSGFDPAVYEEGDTAHGAVWQTLVGDFDGDGLADYADRAIDSGHLYVHLNTGTGFATANFEVVTTTYGPSWETLVGDFDGDGRADYADHSLATGHLFVHRNLGTRFDTAVSEDGFTAHGAQWETLIGDFDGDRRADFADHDLATGALVVHLNTGAGFAGQVYEQTVTPVGPTLEALGTPR